MQAEITQMTPEDYNELIELLDGRIDELTKPIPSALILRFAEALRSAAIGGMDSIGTYDQEDYGNLLEAQNVVNDMLPPILESIRATSIDSNSGWQFTTVSAGNGDYGLCAICEKPFQHFGQSVQVHIFDDHPNAFRGVCRGCVCEYGPIAFVEREEVETWLKQNKGVCVAKEKDSKREGQRIDLIDAIRQHAHSTSYFGDIVQAATKWSEGSFSEWR